MARWGFVRHGQSVANAEGWLAGHIDAPLTALGREQAAAVSVDAGAWTRILSSDLSRAAHTAAIALPGVEVPAVSALRERTIGAWDGRRIDAIKAAGEWELLLEWDGRPPGGESNRLLAMRVLRWLVEQPDQDTLIFAHGGLIRSITGLVDGMPLADIPYRKVANCEVQIRDMTPSAWRALLDAV